MNIDESILSKIYMSQNYDPQPLEPEKKVDNTKGSGSKPEVEKSLEDRSVFQIGENEYDLTSENFRIGLYNFMKSQGNSKIDFAKIRQRLNLTTEGKAGGTIKTIDARSVINEVFAQPKNVQKRVGEVLAGVVDFPKDVRNAICNAVWRQRDNPGIRKFLQSGGSLQDLAAICKLTLESLEAHGAKDFASLMAKSYLKGFTLGTHSSPIAFDLKFEKSYEEDQAFYREQNGVEDRKSLELQSLKRDTDEALAKLENDTKDLLPASDKEGLTVGDKYMKSKYEDAKKDLQRHCASRNEKLTNANADDLKKLSDHNFKDELTKKVDEWVNKMKEFQELAQKLDQLAKFTPDYGKVCGEAPADSKEKANYDRARSKFEADYKQATTSAEGDMCKYLNELKGNDVSDESLKKIWTAHYQNATQQIENEEPKEKKEKPVENVGEKGEVKNEKIDEKKKKNEKIDKNNEVDLDGWYLVDGEKLVEENSNVNKQNNENPKEYPNENKLAKFVSNGVFKENYLDCIKDEDAEKTFRDVIIPNLPNLKNRLAELRQKTMDALGFDKKLEPWLMKENPRFDMDSTSFFDSVYSERTKFGGKKVEDVVNMILSKCQIGYHVNYIRKEGGDKPILRKEGGDKPIQYKIIVGERLYDDNDNNNKLTKIYVDNSDAFFGQLIQISGTMNGYEAKVIDSQVKDLVDKQDQIEKLNSFFKDFVGKFLNDLDATVDEKVKSLDGFTENERSEISGMIRKAVTNPIVDAKEKNIWDIEPTALMRNFVGLCVERQVKSADDVKKVVQGIIDKQLEAHFVLKDNDPKVNGLIKDGETMNQDENVSPKDVIELAVENQKGLKQKGANNCFMVSIVNALLGNEKGQKILKNCFCNEDGKYHFKDQKGKTMELTAEEVGVWVGKHEELAKMSKLEQTIWAAWLKAQFETPDKYDLDKLEKNAPGAQCEASDVAFLFGLGEVKDEKEDIDGVSIPESKLGKWVNVKNHLASGNIAIVHQGVVGSGHYEAVTGAESGNDEKFFTCCDSSGSDKRFGFGELQSEKEKNNPGLRRIIRLTLPEIVA